MTNTTQARKYRLRIKKATNFFKYNEQFNKKYADELDWNTLEQLPYWANWDKSKLNKLIIISGIVIMMPSIRLWLKSEHVSIIIRYIGKEMYDVLMKKSYMKKEYISCVNVEDIEKKIYISGISVLYSTLNETMKPWFRNILPGVKCVINKLVAKKVLTEAMICYKNIYNKPQKSQEMNIK
jgi:hypothetical protein